MLDEKGYLDSKIPMHPRDWAPYMTALWRVLLIPALVSPNFTIGRMMCLHYFSFSVMSDKGYFMVWGIVKFKAFHDLFC